MMLVIGIILVVVGMAWPLLERPLAYERLKSAADKVRAAWVQARIDAQTSGEPYVFTVLSEDEYEVSQRSVGLDPDAGAGLNAPAPIITRFEDDPADRVSGDMLDGRLPNDVIFDMEQSFASAETAAAGFADGGFSITFYPDGTTDDLSLDGAGLVLKNQYGHRVLLQLRGLTGMSTMIDLEDDEALAKEAAPSPSRKGGGDE